MTDTPADNDHVERQLSAILRPTTVEDLARKGGPLKMVKERDLRELIRQSLLQLLASETSLGGAEQERILDRIQGELKKRMTAHAAEQAERLALVGDHQVLQAHLAQVEQDYQKSVDEVQRLRAEALLLPQPLPQPALNEDGPRALDAAFFAGRQQREAARFGTPLSDAVTAALHSHLGVCTELLATMVTEPAGVDAAADVVARIRLLVETRMRDQQWIIELQQRISDVSAERDEARAAAEAELQHTIEVETQRDELLAASAVTESAAGMQRMPVMTLPDTQRDGEISAVREQLAAALAAQEEAQRSATRANHDLATVQAARHAAEQRVSVTETQLTLSEQRQRELQQQLGDQRKTTDLARLASVEAEAMRREVDGFKTLLREREQVLASERARHRADGAVHLQALKRIEQALLVLREQLAERDQQLAEARAELIELGSAADVTERISTVVASDTESGLEVTALRGVVAQGRQDQSALNARLVDLERACRQAERERDELRSQQADCVHITRERDLIVKAMREVESRLAVREQELSAMRVLAKPVAVPATEKQSQVPPELAPIHAELVALRAALQRRPLAGGRHGGSSRYR